MKCFHNWSRSMSVAQADSSGAVHSAVRIMVTHQGFSWTACPPAVQKAAMHHLLVASAQCLFTI